MKNLKKVLSLVLALSMALSLMTVAFAADASDFKDYNEVKYDEAVDVMVAAGVFNGVAGNNFAPNDTLTREQAAKIVTYMLVGQTQADKLVTTIAPYADVAAGRWSAGAIAYCTNEGILAGVGGNKFAPTRELTGLEFAKMVLCALGFDAAENGLEGSSWAINTSKLAIKEELDENLEDISLSKVMTREQACQMALNAVKYTTSEDVYAVDDNGKKVTFDNLNDALLYVAIKNNPKVQYLGKDKDYSEALIADVFDITVANGVDSFPLEPPKTGPAGPFFDLPRGYSEEKFPHKTIEKGQLRFNRMRPSGPQSTKPDTIFRPSRKPIKSIPQCPSKKINSDPTECSSGATESRIETPVLSVISPYPLNSATSAEKIIPRPDRMRPKGPQSTVLDTKNRSAQNGHIVPPAERQRRKRGKACERCSNF